jgi:hypothetical protein
VSVLQNNGLKRRMNMNIRRMLIWAAMLLFLVGLINAMVHQSASGALIYAGGLISGISLLLNAHLIPNKIRDIPAAVQSGRYDRRSHYYGRAGGLLIVAGFVVALIGH